MVFRVRDGLLHALDDRGRRRQIRIADAEVDDVHPAGDGFLLLGAAETVVGLTDAFKPMADKRGLYVPNAAKFAARASDGNVIKFAAKA